VQGDERDSIFISTLFGPQEIGLPVMQHFGPINSKAGHRRLNVLFTRAKERVHIVTSLKTSDIKADDDATIGKNSYGRKVLKNYLEFAHTGKLYGGDDTDRESGSEFQDHIARVLKQKGYEVKQEIGVAGYFIDIGIKHPSFPNGYLLGVEADGATYHSSKSARDRDRLRQQVLEGLGWTLYRVWSTDWYNHQDNETEKLVNFIEQQAELKKQRTTH
jgi:very-short-patch-repair endonuclease